MRPQPNTRLAREVRQRVRARPQPGECRRNTLGRCNGAPAPALFQLIRLGVHVATGAARRRSARGVAIASSPGFEERSEEHTPKWTISRVLFRERLSPLPVRIIHLGDVLPRRSSALTRVPGSANQPNGRAALGGTPIQACSGKGLPRRRSPGCRAWALTPRFHPYLCGWALARSPDRVALASDPMHTPSAV